MNVPVRCPVFLFPCLFNLYLLYQFAVRSDQILTSTCIANTQRNAIKWYKYILANFIKKQSQRDSLSFTNVMNLGAF